MDEPPNPYSACCQQVESATLAQSGSRHELVTKCFDASCIGVQIAQTKSGRRSHLNHLLIRKKQQLHIVPESHYRRFDNRLHEITVIDCNRPIVLLGNPRF